MHEYSIVSSLVDGVERVVAKHPGARVRRVHVDIGEIELLRTAFTTFRDKTICENAELAIHPVAADWRCPACHKEIPVGASLRCPECHRPAALVAGDEITLARVEMEINDV
jgi:hydrogenase nickel incorporation protein HypA/HybF